MNAEDLRYYITSLGETRRIMSDIVTILTTQEQTISDIVNHPTYQIAPPRRFVPNYYGISPRPRFVSRTISPPRNIRRNYRQSPIARPNRTPPSEPLTSSTTTTNGVSPTIRPSPPSWPSTRLSTENPPAPSASVPIPVRSNLDVINEEDTGPSNSNTPRSAIRNRLFGTSISANLSPNRSYDSDSPSNDAAAQATPIANRIADLLGVALFNEITAAGLSPVTVAPTDRQIRDSTELIQYNTIFDPASASEPQYTRCPISHEEFTINSRVYRIRHCGHYFEPSSLLTWFRTSVRCPVCRYDIRTHLDSNTAHTVEEEDIEDDDDDEEELIEETVQSNANSLEDFISSVRTDQRENPIPRNRQRVYRYQFELSPFITRAAGPNFDPSGNL